MVPSGLRETYFFLLRKELGNLRQRDLTKNFYHAVIVNMASLCQPPRAPELAPGWGLRPLSLAAARGSCDRGGSTSGLRGSGKASNQSLIRKTRAVVATPLQFAILKVQESSCLKPMDVKGIPEPGDSGATKAVFWHFFTPV